ncbi:MAG: hypothetical protein HFJ30_00330 [Clostridia bacterium]|jgi:transcription elongation factor Elf1|nr:hypothetical protein [Clostridia bacterium]
MSKRKDRAYTDYRCCPVCQSKHISVTVEKKFLKKQYYIYCYNCNKKIKVEVQDDKQRRNRKS